ncbi:hypothetical protein LKD70_14925 [Ruminococcus sp. CLA-AA-H200]|uniref:Uncharacterized protein n=1 Tax=Ruminococcus turbiniformis TaxID=2881258 RepID=A0ABS8G090_9FIRM|nr:hypothetical protein [Ruminococcus turbiniformis]MCC2255686.1 hypothetical protein [Ruminococcus turbiniformis]
MSEYYKRGKDFLKKELERLKEQGLRVFINKSEDSCYGLVTDGDSIVSINHELMHTFTLTYDYPPQKGHGTGVSEFAGNSGTVNLSKNDFYRCVSYGENYAFNHDLKTYKSFDDYVQRNGTDFETFYEKF